MICITVTLQVVYFDSTHNLFSCPFCLFVQITPTETISEASSVSPEDESPSTSASTSSSTARALCLPLLEELTLQLEQISS